MTFSRTRQLARSARASGGGLSRDSPMTSCIARGKVQPRYSPSRTIGDVRVTGGGEREIVIETELVMTSTPRRT